MSQRDRNLFGVPEDIVAKGDKGKGSKGEGSSPKFHWKTQVGAVVAVATAVAAGAFYFGTLQMRTEFGERMVRLETTVGGIEKKTDFLIQKYVLRDSRAQAEKILSSQAVQVAYVTPRSTVTQPSENRVSIPDKSSKGRVRLVAIYSIEGFVEDKLIMKVQMVMYEDGKVSRITYDRRVQIRPPTEPGKPVTYRFRFSDKDGKPLHNPVRVEVVLLERVAPDGLIVATALNADPAIS